MTSERKKAYMKRYYVLNRDRLRQQRKAWHQSHQTQSANLSRLWHAQLREDCFRAYGDKCTCCGEQSRAFLTIDHIGGGGVAHRRLVGASGVYSDLRKRGYPKEGYQILCMNCNWAVRRGAVCPHQVVVSNLGVIN